MGHLFGCAVLIILLVSLMQIGAWAGGEYAQRELIQCSLSNSIRVDFTMYLTIVPRAKEAVEEWLREQLVEIAATSPPFPPAGDGGFCTHGGYEIGGSLLRCLGIPVRSMDRLFGGSAGLCMMRDRSSRGDRAGTVYIASRLSEEDLLRRSGMDRFVWSIDGLSSSVARRGVDEHDKGDDVQQAAWEARREARQQSAFEPAAACPLPTGSVFFDPAVLMSHNCPSATTCVAQLCTCIGSTDTPSSIQMCKTQLSRTSCGAYPSCIAAYSACVYTAASSAKASQGSTCSTWGSSLSVALANALTSTTPFAQSLVSTTCEAEMCRFMNSSLVDGNCTAPPSLALPCSFQVVTTTAATTATATGSASTMSVAVTTSAVPSTAAASQLSVIPTTAGVPATPPPAGGEANLTALQYTLTFPGDYSVLAANATALSMLSRQLEIDLAAKLGASCVVQSLALGSLVVVFIAYVPSDPTTVALVKSNALVINGSPDLSWLAKSATIIRANGGPPSLGVLSISNPIVVVTAALPPYPTRVPRTYLIPSSAGDMRLRGNAAAILLVGMAAALFFL